MGGELFAWNGMLGTIQAAQIHYPFFSSAQTATLLLLTSTVDSSVPNRSVNNSETGENPSDVKVRGLGRRYTVVRPNLELGVVVAFGRLAFLVRRCVPKVKGRQDEFCRAVYKTRTLRNFPRYLYF